MIEAPKGVLETGFGNWRVGGVEGALRVLTLDFTSGRVLHVE